MAKYWDTFTEEYVDEKDLEVTAPPERYFEIKDVEGMIERLKSTIQQAEDAIAVLSGNPAKERPVMSRQIIPRNADGQYLGDTPVKILEKSEELARELYETFSEIDLFDIQNQAIRALLWIGTVKFLEEAKGEQPKNEGEDCDD